MRIKLPNATIESSGGRNWSLRRFGEGRALHAIHCRWLEDAVETAIERGLIEAAAVALDMEETNRRIESALAELGGQYARGRFALGLGYAIEGTDGAQWLLTRQSSTDAVPREEFSGWFAEWLPTFHARPRSGDGMNGQSCDEVYAANLREKRTASDELMDCLLLRTESVKVGRNGVMYKGLRYGQYEPALIPIFGEQVILRVDPKDLSYVTVWTLEGKFICRVRLNDRIPFKATGEQLRAAISEKKRHKKRVDEYYEARPRLHLDLPELMIAAAARQARAIPQAPTPTIVPVQSKLADQMPALKRAMKSSKPAVRSTDAIDLLKIINQPGFLPTPEQQGDAQFTELMEQLRENESRVAVGVESFSGRFLYQRSAETQAALDAEERAYREAARPFRPDKLKAANG